MPDFKNDEAEERERKREDGAKDERGHPILDFIGLHDERVQEIVTHPVEEK